MKKSLLFIFVLVVSFMFLVSFVYAEAPVKVLLNGNYIEFSEPPISPNGCTMVPASDISESFGLTMSWDAETQTVTGTSQDINIQFTIGKKAAKINGVLKQLDVAPALAKGHAMIPLRFFAESLGGQVEWNNESSTVMITCKSVTNPKYKLNDRGNSGGNLYSRGFIAEQGDWIYFNDDNDTYSLYKVKKDGTSLTALNAGKYNLHRQYLKEVDYPEYLNVVGNWIYYIGSYWDVDNKIHADITRMCVDGTKKQVLFPDILADRLVIEGDKLYFVNDSDNRSIYTAKTDGTGLRKLTTDPVNKGVNNLVVHNGYVYFSDASGYLFRTDADGSNIFSYGQKVWSISAEGNYIYYVDFYTGNSKLVRMNIDGTNREILVDESVAEYNISDKYIYFLKSMENYALYRANMDGSGQTLIDNTDTIWNLNSVEDWVTYNRGNGRYFVKPGGTEAVEMRFLDLALYAYKYGIKPYAEDLSNRGNYIVNNKGRAIAAKEGEWIYYIKPVNPNSIQYTYAGKIYKIKEDGTGETLVCSDLASSINVKDGWIYYIRVTNGPDSIYKIRTDGTGKTQLKTDIKANQDILQIVGDWIYYKEEYAGRSIMRMKLDGSNRQSLIPNIEDLIQSFTVVGDWIYYTKYDLTKDDYYTSFPYKMKTDGSMKSRIDDMPSDIPAIEIIGFRDYIYYSDRIYKNDGTEKAISRLNVVNIDGEWIYYLVVDNASYMDYKEKLYRVRMDGTGNTLLYESKYIRHVNFAGDWIFIIANQDEFDDNLYRMKKDGTAVMKLTNN